MGIHNLVSATKLNSGSIYSAFKSKEDLFLERLEFHGQRSVANLKQCINESKSSLEGIKLFLKVVVDKSKSDDKRGCLMVNTVLEMSCHSEAVQRQTKKQLQAVEDELLKGLEQAQ